METLIKYVIEFHIKADEERTPLPTRILYLSLVSQAKMCQVRSVLDEAPPRKPWLLQGTVLTIPVRALSSESALDSFSGLTMLRCAELLSFNMSKKKPPLHNCNSLKFPRRGL